MENREFKDFVYEHLSRLAHAFSAAKRLELLDVLSQGQRDVESLSRLASMTVANTSRHLQILKQARLVEDVRDGVRKVYRIVDDKVVKCFYALMELSRHRSWELRGAADSFFLNHDGMEAIEQEELEKRMADGEILLLDVRPREEYAQGHIKGALSMPYEELVQRLSELPKDREIVAYCRGPYCVMSVEAIEILRAHGYRAIRLADGLPQWKLAGRPIAHLDVNP